MNELRPQAVLAPRTSPDAGSKKRRRRRARQVDSVSTLWAELRSELTTFADQFVPESLRSEPDELRRARLVVLTTWALALSSWVILPFQVGFPLYGRPIGVWAQLTGVLIAVALPVVQRVTKNTRLVAALVPIGMTCFVGTIAWFDGGWRSTSLMWLPVVPLVAAFLSSGAVLTISTFGCIALAQGIYLLDAQGYAFPNSSALPPPAAKLITLDAMMLFASVIGWSVENSRRYQLQHLRDTLGQLGHSVRLAHASEEQLRELADHLSSAVWIGAMQSRQILYANPAFERIWGESPDALQEDATVFAARIHPDDRDLLDPDIPFLLDYGRAFVFRVVQHDGTIRWVRYTTHPIIDSGRIVGIATDITEEREAEDLRSRFVEATLHAQEAERAHLARELHDQTGQSLAALLVGLRALEDRTTEKSQLETIQFLREGLRTVVTDISRLARGLHPAALGELGLAAALGQMAREVERTTRLAVEVEVLGIAGRPLPSAIDLTLYRITQEALANVVRHAGATSVWVLIERRGAEVYLRVRDDGRGLPPDVERTGSRRGLGLLSMRERTVLLGGRIRFGITHADPGGTDPGTDSDEVRRGTEIEVWLPIEIRPPAQI
jgi:PAS domain S-box-containing protein